MPVSLLLSYFFSLIPIPLIYSYYFDNFIFKVSKILEFQAFFYGILLCLFNYGILHFLDKPSSIYSAAFFYAGFLEEALRFIVIILTLRFSSRNFSIVKGTMDAILIGLGFAFVENILYSASNPSFIILLRAISSVPMHALLSGIMGYYISLALLSSDAREKKIHFMKAFLFPWILHSLFDFSLFSGGNWNFSIMFQLIFSFFFLEILFSHARKIPPAELLKILGIDAKSMEMIEEQKQYEEWMHNAQDQSKNTIGLFVSRWSLKKNILGSFILLAGLSCFMILRFHPTYSDSASAISLDVLFSLFVGIPFTIFSMFLVSEKINYRYFRDYFLRIPAGIYCELSFEDMENHSAVLLNISHNRIFVEGKLKRPPEVDQKISLKIFEKSKTMFSLRGKVAWVNQFNPKLPIGTLVYIESPGLTFILFNLFQKLRKLKNIFSSALFFR